MVVVSANRTVARSKAPDLALLRARRDEILQVASRHGASNVRVYGSAARGDARPDSDVDLLVDLEAGRSLIDEVLLQQELEALLGYPVDVAEEVHHAIRDQVHAEAIPL